ncbi:hypothetical protein [Amycolatopsis alkalitolerans]|uniref:Uncharacterized protein n=1 Tax=Amycolatopsis alkalitolerans TaxID=2547244 RepID=A0A5C4MAN6_9PSEU|nr:hypothetical protein [Amycolatopsis alkalitolerans]TNC28550.1 hypothetical protein FG385_04560 [Amycolatopsis alkalitolerans]
MSRESGQDRSQKTVAELLALHGGNVEGRRRHRRAAEEDDEQQPNGAAPRRARGATDTGPQAIIDRVRGDNPPPPNGRRNGGRRALPDDDAPPAPPRPQQDSAALPRPNGAPPPPPSGNFPRPVPPASGAFPKPNVAPPESGAFPRPAQEPAGFPPPEPGGFPRQNMPPQPSEPNGFKLPARRRPPHDSGPLRRPPQESAPLPLPEQGEEPRPRAAEETRQVPPLHRAPQPGALSARLDGLDVPAPDETADPGPPPGGMPSGAFAAPPRRPFRRRPGRPPAEPEQHTEQFQAVNGKQPPEAAVPQDAPPAGLSRWHRRRDQVAAEDTEVGVMPAVRDEPEPHPSGFARAPHVPDEQLEATGFHDPFADDDEEVDEFGDFGEAEPERRGAGYEYEDEAADEYEEDAEPASEASPARQWLSMAGQLALGVVGGAAVWLGFNWLWGKIPAAALVVALAVIVGLVWIVRKIRRADDIQTMVLAVLVGLVVTVSPAALLLLSR